MYSLSFSDDFWGDAYNAKRSKRPTTIADALASMSKKDWDRMARDVFGVKGDYLEIDEVMLKIQETNTCSNLNSPVEVWIDEEGYYTVLVYDPAKAENKKKVRL